MRLVARERVKDNRFDEYQDMFLCLEIFQLMVQVILYAAQLGLWQLTMLQELLVRRDKCFKKNEKKETKNKNDCHKKIRKNP